MPRLSPRRKGGVFYTHAVEWEEEDTEVQKGIELKSRMLKEAKDGQRTGTFDWETQRSHGGRE